MFTFDVIIPAYKPDANLIETIAMLRRQTISPCKIIIVNTHAETSSDVISCLRKESDIIVSEISKKEFNHGATRNLGASLSSSDYILFMTQDALLADERVCESLYGAFEDPDVCVAYARQVARPSSRKEESLSRLFNYPPQGAIKSKLDLPRLGLKTFFCSNVCALYRRSSFYEFGCFPSDVDFNEDMIFASRVIFSGKKVAYVAEAVVLHSHNFSISQLYHRYYDLGRSQSAHPEVFGSYRSSGEGVRYFSFVAKRLLSSGSIFSFFRFVLRTSVSYVGYMCGKRN